MKMILVVGVSKRPQHRRERIARTTMDGAQECLLARVPPPAILHRNLAAVREFELRYVDSIGVTVFGELCSRHMIYRSTAVGPCDLQGMERNTKMEPRRWLNNGLHPIVECRNHGAAQSCSRVELNAAASSSRHNERLFRTANTWAAKC